MKAHLMYSERDFDKDTGLTAHHERLIQDLELNILISAMANGDRLIEEVSRVALLSGLAAKDEMLYRQNVLRDCLRHPAVVRRLYGIAAEAIERKKREHWWGFTSMYLSSVLSSSVGLLQMFAELLRQLREIADQYAGRFESEGFTRLFSMLQEELNDAYFASLTFHLNALKFRGGVLISAELGEYNQGIHYVLRRQEKARQHWLQWYLAPGYYIHPRDDSGAVDLSQRKDRALNLVTNALAQSVEHVLGFFAMLQTELAFYVGCINLNDRMADLGEPTCFPVPLDCDGREFSVEGVYDISLALVSKERVVGNSVRADDKDLIIITGANRGGKSTFLRSVGQAQLMMHCGMFVPAESFRASRSNGVFTHFKREEDATMTSGKLDEELGRMSEIADQIGPHSMVLFNESFSATNEREGSEIGRQIVRALLERKIRVFFVSHMYDFANGFYGQKMQNALFLRANRQEDGRRTFRVEEGEPLPTSFGDDLYRRIFESAP